MDIELIQSEKDINREFNKNLATSVAGRQYEFRRFTYVPEGDLAYKKLNDEIKKNQNYVEMRSNKKKFEAAKNAVLESEKQAENIVSSYEQGLKFIEQCAGRNRRSLRKTRKRRRR